MIKKIHLLYLTLSLISSSLSALPFMDTPLKADDTVALLLNKYYAEEKTFEKAVNTLQEKKFEFDKELEKFKEKNKRLAEFDLIVAFFKSHEIDVPLHLLGTHSYDWIVRQIFDLEIEAPEDFEKYKKYLPLLTAILKKSGDYVGPFKNTETPQSLFFKTQFSKKYFEQLEKLYKGEMKLPTFEESKFTINRPLSQFKGTRLVLGCSHGLRPTPDIPSCPHVNKQRFDQDYTLNMAGEHDIDDKLTDIVGDYRNPELWKKIPDNHFESVLFEYTPGIMEPRLLKEIIRVLKPGGYVGSSALVADLDERVEIINSWTKLVGKALRTQSYKEVLEAAGFEKIGRSMVDDYVKTDYAPYQKIGLYAFKPKI